MNFRGRDFHGFAGDLHDRIPNEVVMPWMVEDPIMPSRPTIEVSAVAPCSVVARTETMQERGK